MASEKKKVNLNKVLGETARSTLENFIINNLGEDAEYVFEMGPGTVGVENIKAASIHWEDDADNPGETICRLIVKFEKEGTWSPA